MPLPSFLVIGAAKAGTSALYTYLGDHPEIYLSPIKGPCYFAFEEGQRVEVFGPGDQEVFDRHVITDRGAYEALFAGAVRAKAAGEASVLYLYAPSAPARIRRTLPDVKLIVVLRNPVERAFSSFQHLRRDGREPLADFDEALRQEEHRVASGWQHLWHYTRMGFYHAQLRRYYDLFDRAQIGVFLHDDFRSAPRETLRQMFAFLGVDPSFVPDTSTRHNVSGIPRSRALHRALTRPNVTKRLVKRLLSPRLRRRLKARAFDWNTVRDSVRLTAATRGRLTELYREDILQLQALIGRDLSAWLAGERAASATAAPGGR